MGSGYLNIQQRKKVQEIKTFHLLSAVVSVVVTFTKRASASARCGFWNMAGSGGYHHQDICGKCKTQGGRGGVFTGYMLQAATSTTQCSEDPLQATPQKKVLTADKKKNEAFSFNGFRWTWPPPPPATRVSASFVNNCRRSAASRDFSYSCWPVGASPNWTRICAAFARVIKHLANGANELWNLLTKYSTARNLVGWLGNAVKIQFVVPK